MLDGFKGTSKHTSQNLIVLNIFTLISGMPARFARHILARYGFSLGSRGVWDTFRYQGLKR